MKIIGLNGSPRKQGNTAFTIRKVLEGATNQGAETEFFSFSDLKISPCIACMGCKKGDNRCCVITDDMQKIYQSFENADAVVFGSPVYMGQMTAQAKIFMDRLYACITTRFSPFYKEKDIKKKLILVFTQGNPNSEMFREYYDYTKKIFEMLEFEVKDVLVVSGMRTESACDKEDLHINFNNIGSSLSLEQ